VHILRTPKAGKGGSRETLRWDSRGEGEVKAWVFSTFIIAFLLHFGGFDGVCASERNATLLHFFLALHLGINEAGVGLSLFATFLSPCQSFYSRCFLLIFPVNYWRSFLSRNSSKIRFFKSTTRYWGRGGSSPKTEYVVCARSLISAVQHIP